MTVDSKGAGSVDAVRHGAVTVVTLNHPRAYNAMTMVMYAQLLAHIEQIDFATTQALVIMGSGASFCTGTDIHEFSDFASGDDGMHYEQTLENIVAALERLAVTTVAALSGFCTGGGAVLAAVCDIRIGTPTLRYGIPIAKTLGNYLTSRNLARVARVMGVSRLSELILRARLLDADEALTAGLVSELVGTEALGERALALAQSVTAHAPRSVAALREALRRLGGPGPIDDDTERTRIRDCYGSQDFREGVAAFLQKRPPQWHGN